MSGPDDDAKDGARGDDPQADMPAGARDATPEVPWPKPKQRRRSSPVGETLGGIIVGFDQQILRTLPPPHELVLKGAPVRGVSGADGGRLEIVFPDELEPVELPADEPPDDAPIDGEPAEDELPDDGA